MPAGPAWRGHDGRRRPDECRPGCARGPRQLAAGFAALVAEEVDDDAAGAEAGVLVVDEVVDDALEDDDELPLLADVVDVVDVEVDRESLR